MTNANDNANPFFQYNENGYGNSVIFNMPDGTKHFIPYQSGLTKKEYFAAMILQGLTAKYTLNTPEDQITLSKVAIELADTFINELNK